jgi:nicotinamidase-related amidase
VLVDLLRGVITSPCGPHKGVDVVARADKVARALRASGGLVVPVKVGTGPDGKPAPAPLADLTPQAPESLPADWAELPPEFSTDPRDLVITKARWSAFSGTGLDGELRRRGVTTIILGGIATNLGVDSTARSAFERQYDQVMVEDMMTAFDERAHELTVGGVFPLLGRVRQHDEVIAAIEAAG